MRSDHLRRHGAGPGRPPAGCWTASCDRVGDAFTTLHVLPFFPYSSDDGFSVIHFRQVDPALGSGIMEKLGQAYRLMVDLVLNHVSRQSGWFRDFEAGVAPGPGLFHHRRSRGRPVRGGAPAHPPPAHTGDHPPRSAARVDHLQRGPGGPEFSNPDVFFELLDILLFYVNRGRAHHPPGRHRLPMENPGHLLHPPAGNPRGRQIDPGLPGRGGPGRVADHRNQRAARGKHQLLRRRAMKPTWSTSSPCPR
jgi:hypothetical protein